MQRGAGQSGIQRHLHPRHPAAGRLVWAKRERVAVPQPLSGAPVRPGLGVVDPGMRERYAAFALGAFAAYSCDEPLDLSGGLWAAYERYFFTGPRAGDLAVRIARRMMDHIDGLARVHMRTEERLQEQQHLDLTVEEEAEAALMEGVPGGGEVLTVGEEDEEAAPRSGPRSAADEALLLAQGLPAAERMALLHRLLTGAVPPGKTPAHTAYVTDALASVPEPAAAEVAARELQAAPVRPVEEWSKQACSELVDDLMAYDERVRLLGVAYAPGGRLARQRLELGERGADTVVARLFVAEQDVMGLPGPQEQQQGQWPDPAQPDATPPYVRCAADALPEPEEAARLWGLTEDQRVPFLLYAHLLLAEAAGQRQAPVCAVLTGKAGTGKSRIVQALLWLAFQHDCEYLIGLVSYTWRAALQVGGRRGRGGVG